MKKILVLLAILFIGILLAGCTSQPATPVATTAPTMAPTQVATAPPTPVPTTVAPVMNTTQNVTVNATPTVAPTPVPTAAAAPKFTITFTPAGTITNGGTVQIKAGTQVCFVNNDPYKPHGIQATSALTQAYFGSVSIPYGKPYMVTFNKTGTFSYQTLFQPSKVGTIVVTA